jgi:hypothetical protein
MFQVLLNFIRKARLPLLIKIILCTGVPFIFAVCLIFAINFRQYAETSSALPFVLKNVAYLAVTVLVLIGLVYATLFKLVHLPIRNMIAGIGKIGLRGGVLRQQNRTTNWGTGQSDPQVGESRGRNTRR